jgi:hypothetical protein
MARPNEAKDEVQAAAIIAAGQIVAQNKINLEAPGKTVELATAVVDLAIKILKEYANRQRNEFD